MSWFYRIFNIKVILDGKMQYNDTNKLISKNLTDEVLVNVKNSKWCVAVYLRQDFYNSIANVGKDLYILYTFHYVIRDNTLCTVLFLW